MMICIGSIAALWRYPVKSMRGERLERLELEATGIVGDRRFAIESSAAPLGKPLLRSGERTAMLRYTPRFTPTNELVVDTPEGRSLALHSPEFLRELQSTVSGPHGRQQSGGGAPSTFALKTSPACPLTDVRPVSLVSTATLGRLAVELGQPVDPQRFRSNIILQLDENALSPLLGTPPAFPESRLIRYSLHFGQQGEAAGPELFLTEAIPRCRMVSLDPETAEPYPALLPHLAHFHGARLGVYASVTRPGTLYRGDPVFLA